MVCNWSKSPARELLVFFGPDIGVVESNAQCQATVSVLDESISKTHFCFVTAALGRWTIFSSRSGEPWGRCCYDHGSKNEAFVTFLPRGDYDRPVCEFPKIFEKYPKMSPKTCQGMPAKIFRKTFSNRVIGFGRGSGTWHTRFDLPRSEDDIGNTYGSTKTGMKYDMKLKRNKSTGVVGSEYSSNHA